MIVCVCRRVSDRDIAREAAAGKDFDQISFELGVATQCGGCELSARAVIGIAKLSCAASDACSRACGAAASCAGASRGQGPDSMPLAA